MACEMFSCVSTMYATHSSPELIMQGITTRASREMHNPHAQIYCWGDVELILHILHIVVLHLEK